MATFYIADTHFSHKKILALCPDRIFMLGLQDHEVINEFLKAWSTQDEHLYEERTRDLARQATALHDAALIARWNEIVQPDDVVWCLGDMAFNIHRFDAAQLHGTKCLLRGNHDHANVHQLARQGWIVVDVPNGSAPPEQRDRTWIQRHGFVRTIPRTGHGFLLTHEPVPTTELDALPLNPRFNVHGHTHGQVYQDRDFPAYHRHICVSIEQTGGRPLAEQALLHMMYARLRA